MATVLSSVLIQNELRFLLQLCHHHNFTAVLTSQLCRQPELPDQQREVNVDMQFLEVPKRLRPAWNATAQGAPNSPTCKLSTSTQLGEGAEHWPLVAFCVVPHTSTRDSRYKSQQLWVLYIYTLCLALEDIILVYSQAFAYLQAVFPSQENELVHEWLPARRSLAPSG